MIDTRWLLKRIEERGESIASLARAVGRDRAVVHRILNGDQPMQLWMTPILSEKLGITETELLSRSGELNLPPLSCAPIIPWHSVGAFSMTKTHIELSSKYERIAVQIDSDTLIAVRVSDKSMDGLFPEGSIVVADYSQKDIHNYEVGIFTSADHCVLRRYRVQRRKPYLVAESVDGITEEEFCGDIIGRVVAVPLLSRHA